MSNIKFERRLQKCLDQLGIALRVVCVPRTDMPIHGEIKTNVLYIYDENPRDIWLTFEHEVYEHTFKEVTFVYRTIINDLIASVEKIVYERKEKFLNLLPAIAQVIRREQVDAADGE